MAKPDEPSSSLDALAAWVIGAAIEVHRELGPGFGESIYEEALSIELNERQIPFTRQASLSIRYRSHVVGQQRLDLLIDNLLIVELKSVEQLIPLHQAQLLSYLKANGLTLGLLINFNVPVLKNGIRRVILSPRSLGALCVLCALALN